MGGVDARSQAIREVSTAIDTLFDSKGNYERDIAMKCRNEFFLTAVESTVLILSTTFSMLAILQQTHPQEASVLLQMMLEGALTRMKELPRNAS